MSLMNAVEDFITSVSRHTVSNAMPDYCDLRTIVNLTESDRNFYSHCQIICSSALRTSSGKATLSPASNSPWRLTGNIARSCRH
ncbi:hypothetical protein ACQSI4_003370 [Enterobacter hormaechei]